MDGENDTGGKAYSRVPTVKDLKMVARLLNTAGAKYILVGGFAVNYHGLPRMTHDIDLLVDPSSENMERVKKALACLPDSAAEEIDVNDVKKYTVVRIADEIVIDLIGKIGGLDIHNAGFVMVGLDDVEIPIADLDTMIRTKQGLRGKDKDDLKFLLLKKRKTKESREGKNK
ncbi:MAG TPA: nucleotidyl transferase AbiEii/AbiGii toxin family protein [Spirochaetia bacterium]|nr:nucleotidyl transferase AbiEii/AbiGii toxin family protein [Spirochaetia bacterium]